MDILDEIIVARKHRVTAAKVVTPLAGFREKALAVRLAATPHALLYELSQPSRLNVIAEFKRRSPSKGVIRVDADPASVARAYQRGGAAAISVLTEQDHFGGSLADVRAVRDAVTLPILRKDFIVDEYQVWESAAVGADALLLIVAALSDGELKILLDIAENVLGMDALVEVHTEVELQRAVVAGAKLIGVNNRNLRTFEVSLETSIELAGKAPADVTLISESGLHNSEDLCRLAASGFKGFLIGETLMRAVDPESALRALLSKSQ
ncbi:MAG: trpC [Acidobacteria bacterium]|nr:trpC [Acidobacteriota bacterium]